MEHNDIRATKLPRVLPLLPRNERSCLMCDGPLRRKIAHNGGQWLGLPLLFCIAANDAKGQFRTCLFGIDHRRPTAETPGCSAQHRFDPPRPEDWIDAVNARVLLTR